MKLCFDSIEEVKEFVGSLKGTRGGKADKSETETATGSAPAPMQPPAGGAAPMETTTFAPPSGAPQGGFPGAGATSFPTGPAPEIAALVQRISTRLDAAISGGQPAEAARAWLASQCGPEAANATLDQIKSTFLAKLSQPVLENIAKLMAA